jgi:hypothetical protein
MLAIGKIAEFDSSSWTKRPQRVPSIAASMEPGRNEAMAELRSARARRV